MSRLSSHRGGRPRIAPRLLALCTALTLAACSEPYNAVAPPHQAAPATQANASAKGDRVATVDLTPLSASMAIGDTTMFTATPRDAKGNALTGRVVTWAISDTTIATVSPTGAVRALAPGVASVTATADGKSASAALSVVAPPPTGTRILPGQSIQAAVDANPGGTAFVIATGVHRLQQVVPKSGNTFTGEPGAVMNGARLLTTFTREGSYWVATGQTQEGTNQQSASGICLAGYERCIYPWNLFIDDVPLRHATSLAGVGAGSFYFDFAADKIYFATDPTGRKVEAAVAQFAFQSSATNVTVRSLVIEKYANFLQQGAVAPNVGTATGWLIEGNEVRLNHGEGVRIGTGARVLGNKIHHQGQLGIGAPGDNVLVDNNEVYENNFAGVYDEFSAGGIKVHGVTGNLSDGITLSNNRVHDNKGRGIWCDFNCIRTVYEGNVVERNTSWGIEQEIGYAATIRNNTLTGNGGGVFVSTSQDVEVVGNTINGPYPVLGLDQPRGTGYYGTLILGNLNVHDNTVTPTTGYVGVLQTSGTDAAFTSRNNRFDRNTYYLSSSTARVFRWANGELTQTDWRARGLDLNGIFR